MNLPNLTRKGLAADYPLFMVFRNLHHEPSNYLFLLSSP
nr:MAG TPA: hypothetical protein [Caudoviricetes sp.]DAQ57204.1 MAG TPA: hypothetical protein [Caudoviricetes sp.]